MAKRFSKNLRLTNYDYSACGCYFVTICTNNKECIFGTVAENRMYLNSLGLMVEQEWLHLPERFPSIEISPFIVMPNHIHAIITLYNPTIPGLSDPNCNIPHIIQSFKSITTIVANKLNHTPGKKLWQKNYYEHIIRNDEEYRQTGIYIQHNIAKWNGEI